MGGGCQLGGGYILSHAEVVTKIPVGLILQLVMVRYRYSISCAYSFVTNPLIRISRSHHYIKISIVHSRIMFLFDHSIQ